MRLATILVEGRPRPAVVRDDDRVIPIDTRATGLPGIRALAAGGPAAMERLMAWLDEQPASAGTPLANVTLRPAVPDPHAIYTVGRNDDGPGAAPPPDRPLIYGQGPGIRGWPRRETPTRDGARTGAPAAHRRYRHGLHRGDRPPHHDHRLTATRSTT